MKLVTFIFILSLNLFATKPFALQYLDIKVNHTFLNGETKEIIIQREIDNECTKIAMYPENFTDENIKNNIPSKCKKEFIVTKGVVEPFIIDEKVKTIGEIEVLDFIYNKSSKEPSNYALIDTRKAIWFDSETIPSAINVPYEDLQYDEDFIDDFQRAYKNLGVKVVNQNKFDFSNAKTVVFFCNGAWCPISTKSIKYLIELGYPKEKILWYRGGLSSWKSLSFTTIKK